MTRPLIYSLKSLPVDKGALEAVIPLVIVRLLGMCVIWGSPKKKKIEYVHLLQIECMAKKGGGESEGERRSF